MASVLWLSAAGCSISTSFDSSSESSGSISDSISSPFQSSSDSSGGGGAHYKGDVEEYTVAALEAAGSRSLGSEQFARGLARIAADHGISDWEAVDGTYQAVGAGLYRSGLTADAAMAIGAELVGSDQQARALLLEGYRAAATAS